MPQGSTTPDRRQPTSAGKIDHIYWPTGGPRWAPVVHAYACGILGKKPKQTDVANLLRTTRRTVHDHRKKAAAAGYLEIDGPRTRVNTARWLELKPTLTWTQVSTALLDHPGVDRTMAIVASRLIEGTERDRPFAPSSRTLGDDLGVRRQTGWAAIHRLEQLNIVETEHTDNVFAPRHRSVHLDRLAQRHETGSPSDVRNGKEPQRESGKKPLHPKGTPEIKSPASVTSGAVPTRTTNRSDQWGSGTRPRKERLFDQALADAHSLRGHRLTKRQLDRAGEVERAAKAENRLPPGVPVAVGILVATEMMVSIGMFSRCGAAGSVARSRELIVDRLVPAMVALQGEPRDGRCVVIALREILRYLGEHTKESLTGLLYRELTAERAIA